jgi:hypothetical protein
MVRQDCRVPLADRLEFWSGESSSLDSRFDINPSSSGVECAGIDVVRRS